MSVVTDKDLENIKDRAIMEWRQINGENNVARAYFNAVCVWLKENGCLETIPNYEPRKLSINNVVEE